MVVIKIISFTAAGAGISLRVCDLLKNDINGSKIPAASFRSKMSGMDTVSFKEQETCLPSADHTDIKLYSMSSTALREYECIQPVTDGLDKWCGSAFSDSAAIIFIGACAIAVRAIAPYLRSKLKDPAVIVIDDRGENVISLLSGHIGGANRLCRRLSQGLMANCVVTTSSDINGRIAIDEWAADNGLIISDMDLAKKAAAAMADGRKLKFYSDAYIEGSIPSELTVLKTDKDAADIAVTNRVLSGGNTLRLIPKNVIIGAGCRKGAGYDDLKSHVDSLIKSSKTDPRSIAAVASIDLKADEHALVRLAEEFDVPFLTFPAGELMKVPGDFAHSEFVQKTTGSDNVCERAAAAAAKGAYPDNASFICRKSVGKNVTASLLEVKKTVSFKERSLPGKYFPEGRNILYVVGTGPGEFDQMTIKAAGVLKECELIVGYTTYAGLIRKHFPEKKYYTSPMRTEESRCKAALRSASEGVRTVLICGGDPGIYSLSGLMLTLADSYPSVELQIIPGVTAACSGGALVGAPLSGDFAVISLSDLLTPWEIIEKRLRAASRSDLAICIYNPRSHNRPDNLRRTCDILLEDRSPDTVCSAVRNIGRSGQECRFCSLSELGDLNADMQTTVFVGSSHTYLSRGRMITPRGYEAEKRIRSDECQADIIRGDKRGEDTR